MFLLHFNQKTLDLSQPRIMGILNCTPNSFSDGGDYYDVAKALDRALEMVEEGADIIDIGAESTNPKASPITAKEEIKRLLPIVRVLVDKLTIPISIDSFRADTIHAMIQEGVDIINDVTGLGDQNTLPYLANSDVAIILMHMLGSPQKMHVTGNYDAKGIVNSVRQHLLKRAHLCLHAGINKNRIILDPGFGFDKSFKDQLILLNRLHELHDTNYPILSGLSRKRLIGEVTHVSEAKERLAGSLSAALWAFNQGSQIVRVHDVKATKEALLMWQAITTKQMPHHR